MELNKDRIFSESPAKTLRQSYSDLKNDYTKINAIKHKSLYKDESMSFILNNSEYIFTEPMQGYSFYKEFIINHVLPLYKINDELFKINNYRNVNNDKMSDQQQQMYDELSKVVSDIYDSKRNTIAMYMSTMENPQNIMHVYDMVYEYDKHESDDIFEEVEHILLYAEEINLIDTINVFIDYPDKSSSLMMYMSRIYTKEPKTPDEYKLNTYITNTIRRMCDDSYYSSKIQLLPNMNLRYTLLEIAGFDESKYIKDLRFEVAPKEKFECTSTADAINSIMFEDTIHDDYIDLINYYEKTNRLMCEKAIVEMNKGFLINDLSYVDDDTNPARNSVVESICIESTEIEKIPNSICDRIMLLEERLDEINKEIQLTEERYFSSDGGPSKVISQSTGGVYDKKPEQLAVETKPETKSATDKQPDSDIYTPKVDDTANDISTKDVDDDQDEDDDDTAYKKREDAKKRRDEKYANAEIDDFESAYEYAMYEADEEDESQNNETSNEIDYGIKKKKEKKVKPPKVEKPQKRPFLQRIQNHAIDRDVKFKKKLANAERTGVDAKNAGKAVAKIPTDVNKSIKKQVSEWDEMDDNRRKEYIIQPGNRKKYFRLLKLCIIHGAFFMVNPILNVITFICQKFSNDKNVRIRNELTRELKTEIKVVEEKIEVAKRKDDDQAVYKLIRIKEKLNAEVLRVSANSKYV